MAVHDAEAGGGLETSGAAAPSARASRRPGRPRSEQVKDAILDAVIGLLSDGVSYDLLSMETIAARAGVGKAAIYRRWANKEELVLATLQRTFHATARIDPAGHCVREDLIDLIQQMRKNILETHEGVAFAVLIQTLSGNADLMDRYHEIVIEPRREQYRHVLRRGMGTGELRPDLDVERTTVMLTSTLLFVCRLYPAFEVTEDYCVALVDDLLRGASAPSPAAHAPSGERGESRPPSPKPGPGPESAGGRP